MLRIDETSNTLVAPQAGGLVTEVNPDRAELLALLASSWEAFSAELGHPSLRLRGRRARSGPRHPRLRRAGGPRRRRPGDRRRRVRRGRPRAAAAAQVASWDAAALSAVHESLSAAVPGDSPQVVLIAGGFDAATVATVDWLARRHGVELSCFAVSFLRFGAERMLTVRREFPPRDAAHAGPRRRGPAAAGRRRAVGRRRHHRASPAPRPRASRLRARPAGRAPAGLPVRSAPHRHPHGRAVGRGVAAASVAS